MNNKVICVQAFIKEKELSLILEDLEKCINVQNYTLLIFIDSYKDMPWKKPNWVNLNKNTKSFIYNYINSKNSFKKIQLLEPDTNQGPYLGCKNTIDTAFENSDYIIFLEDDVRVSKDFLIYHERVSEINNIFTITGYPMLGLADYTIDAVGKVRLVDWSCSFEFGVNLNIWEKYGYLRGKSVGDYLFAEACRKNGLKSIYPATPRSKRTTFQENSFSLYMCPEKSVEEKDYVLSDNENNIIYYIE